MLMRATVLLVAFGTTNALLVGSAARLQARRASPASNSRRCIGREPTVDARTIGHRGRTIGTRRAVTLTRAARSADLSCASLRFGATTERGALAVCGFSSLTRPAIREGNRAVNGRSRNVPRCPADAATGRPAG